MVILRKIFLDQRESKKAAMLKSMNVIRTSDGKPTVTQLPKNLIQKPLLIKLLADVIVTSIGKILITNQPSLYHRSYVEFVITRFFRL